MRAAFLALAVLPAAVLLVFGQRQYMPGPALHFWLVACAASVCASASVCLSLIGARRREGCAVLLGTAFSTMTALLAVHGLATPGILVGPNGVIAFAGGLSLPAGIAVLTLSALPPLRRPRRIAPLVAAQVGLALVVVALGAVGLLVPSAVPPV